MDIGSLLNETKPNEQKRVSAGAILCQDLDAAISLISLAVGPQQPSSSDKLPPARSGNIKAGGRAEGIKKGGSAARRPSKRRRNNNSLTSFEIKAGITPDQKKAHRKFQSGESLTPEEDASRKNYSKKRCMQKQKTSKQAQENGRN